MYIYIYLMNRCGFGTVFPTGDMLLANKQITKEHYPCERARVVQGCVYLICVCACVCVCVVVCVVVCVFVWVCLCVNSRVHAHLRPFACSYSKKCINTRTKYARSKKRTYMHTHACMCLCLYLNTCVCEIQDIFPHSPRLSKTLHLTSIYITVRDQNTD